MIRILFYLVGALVSLTACGAKSSENAYSQPPKDTANYRYRPPVFPEEMDFAGEALPLNRWYVRENLERELFVNANFHSSTLQYLKRITRYFPVIEPVLAQHQVPDDFKYLSLIESDFLYKISPRGAAGFWQFMRETAIQYGLEVNREVDERYDLEKSTAAACRYLQRAYELYGSWTMAAASYNMGSAGLSKLVGEQKTCNYYDLQLNEETARYLYRIVAVKQILTHPTDYGFFVTSEERYQPIPYRSVEVNGPTDWVEFALKLGNSYNELRLLNPWIRAYKLTNAARKTYMVKIPE